MTIPANQAKVGTGTAETNPELGELFEHPKPIHFIGGPLCGMTLATRQAGSVRVDSQEIRGRTHIYRRNGVSDPANEERVVHARIDDSGREAAKP